MAIPLMMLGPGGEFSTRYDIKGRDLVRGPSATLEQQPDTETAGSMASWDQSGGGRGGSKRRGHGGQARQGDRYEHSQGRVSAGGYTASGRPAGAAADAAVLGALLAWLSQQQQDLERLREQGVHWRQVLTRAECLGAASPGLMFQRRKPVSITLVGKESFVESHTESHTQATSDSDAHPRLPTGSRLFADDAGARGRVARQQGHRFRTRRGPDSQRRVDPSGQQSTLFGG